MADNATKLSPGDIPRVRNALALTYLNVALGNMILAATAFQVSNQEQHEAVADQIFDVVESLRKQVTK